MWRVHPKQSSSCISWHTQKYIWLMQPNVVKQIFDWFNQRISFMWTKMVCLDTIWLYLVNISKCLLIRPNFVWFNQKSWFFHQNGLVRSSKFVFGFTRETGFSYVTIISLVVVLLCIVQFFQTFFRNHNRLESNWLFSVTIFWIN